MDPELGIGYVQLRTCNSANLLDLPWASVIEVKSMLARRENQVAALASPLLKCALPESPPAAVGDTFNFAGRAYVD